MKPEAQLNMVATLAAAHAVNKVTEKIDDVINFHMSKVLPVIEPKKIELCAKRDYLELPLAMSLKPKSNFSEIMMKCAKWIQGRDLLEQAFLEKAGTRETLQVQQYGDECAVLRRDESTPATTFDASGRPVVLGKSVWVQFETFSAHLDQILPKLMAKGWTIKPPQMNAQLTLNDCQS